jgi:VCBS repeat-containing protein
LKSQSGNVSINDYVVNEAPSVPVLPTNASKVLSNITTTAGKYPIELNWGASTDDHTPSPGLTYAIKIGTTAGGEEIMSANANSDGTRKVSTKGNAEHNSKWKVSLPVGKYYWSVQAIDAAYSGSAFTDPQVFEVSATGVTVNNAPVAIADQITVVKGGTATKLNSNATSVLTNDTDTENNTLTAILVNNVTNGTLTLNSNGTFSYVHNGSDTTTDSFSYKANDGTSNSNTVVVTISIVPFAVDFNNFLIQTKSETCAGKNNGEINIKATQSFNYTATINTINYNFVNNSLIVPNLPPGEYNVCINVTGQSFQQCYKLTIGKGGSLTGKTSGVSSNKVSIEITEGSAPFEVVLNGKSQFTTDQNVFDLDVKVGDVVMVKSSVACEGIYSTVISDLPNSVVAYPNPTKGSFEITVPTEMKEIYVELYSINAVLISKAVYPVVNQKIQLHLDNQTSGTYIAKVYTAIPTSLMIIKN